MIAATAAAAGVYYTGQSLDATRTQNAVAEQGQHTDRLAQEADQFTKAVDQLDRSGPDHLQARLGAIYALERLARDSPRNQPTMVAVLSAFIRTTTPELTPVTTTGAGVPTGIPFSICHQDVADDIQAALTVLGRRDTAHDHRTDRINLRNTCLRGADLTEADFTGADLTGADLTEADLTGAGRDDLPDFPEFAANTPRIRPPHTGANLAGAFLTRAVLHDADLTGANLAGAGLGQADLSDAGLALADLTDADLGSAVLSGVDLRGAGLVGADVRAAYLHDADLRYADLRDTDLSGAYLPSANLAMADLTGKDLQAVNLTGADLRTANLTDANLSSANLTDADLRAADLTGARHDDGTVVSGAMIDEYTAGVWW